MREEIIAKGAELGIWNAEEMSAEVAKSEQKGMMPFSGGAVYCSRADLAPKKHLAVGQKAQCHGLVYSLKDYLLGV